MFGISLRETVCHGLQDMEGCQCFRESMSGLVMNLDFISSGAKHCRMATKAVLPQHHRGNDAYFGF